MGHLVVAQFDKGSEKEFESFFYYASQEISGVKVFGLERLQPEFVAAVESMQENLRKATEEIIKNKWFWTFNPECGWETDRENDKEIVAIDWYTDSEEELEKIKAWLKAFGGRNVTYKKGYDNYEEWE